MAGTRQVATTDQTIKTDNEQLSCLFLEIDLATIITDRRATLRRR